LGPDAQLCFNLANVLNAQGQKQSAIERFRQAVEIDPSFADAWNNLGIALCEIEQLEEACAAFRSALHAEPENYLAHYNLADALEEIGLQDDAIPHWKAYLRYDSASERGAYARGRCQGA
jgi:tetratricopeptide (TPR) repeat protein